jgi:hypothetical protein
MSSTQLQGILDSHDAEERKSREDDKRRQLLSKIRHAKQTSSSPPIPMDLPDPLPASIPASASMGETIKPTKLKSGAVEKWETNVCKQEHYPHRFVGSFIHQFDADDKEWSQNNIPQSLFVADWMQIIKQDLTFDPAVFKGNPDLEKKINISKDHKIPFLADLMYMSHSGKWDTARKFANHRIFEIEASQSLSWDSYTSNRDMLYLMQSSTTDDSGGRKSKRPPSSSSSAATHSSPAGPKVTETRTRPCFNWNRGDCLNTSDHFTNGTLWRHHCTDCAKKSGVGIHKAGDTACPNRHL